MRDTLGRTTNLAANGDGNTVIDVGDYSVWKQNFGHANGEGRGSNTPVPEPAMLVLLMLAAGRCLLRGPAV